MESKDKNLKVVIINGAGGAGKDTFIQFCKDFVEVRSVSSVDVIKEAARVLGWSGGKQLQDRKFLSELKDLSSWYNDLPFVYLKKSYENMIERGEKGILFFHIREPKEIERAKETFDATTVLIRRNNLPAEYGNHADDDVEQYKYDYVVANDGTLDDFSLKAEKFVFDIMWAKGVNEEDVNNMVCGEYRRFAVGTKERRPTAFLTKIGILSRDAQEAVLYNTISDAEYAISECNEPERLKVYAAQIFFYDM